MKGLFFTICFIFGLSAFGQKLENNQSIHKEIQQQADNIFNDLVKIRRDFYSHPELSEQEKRTSKKITQYLLSIGLEVKTHIGGYGVVGILKGNKSGKRIAWRADIDALASSDPDAVDFPSKNKGVRHICGHDVNTTIALGIATVLSGLKENLKGTVYFVFQPSEENLKGAKAMVDDGLFKMIDPEEIYALHISPMPSGMVATKPELLFADYKSVKISFRNQGDKEAIIDYTKGVLSNLQTVEPDSKFWDARNLMDPAMGLGNPNTIFKDYLTVNQNFKIDETNDEISISTILSASNVHKLDSIIPLVKQEIDTSKFNTKLISAGFTKEYAIVLNDTALATKTLKSLSGIYGNQNILPLYGVIPDGRSDDFALFQKQVKGVYFLLGGSNFEKGIISMPHSPNFAVDESCIKSGVKVFSSLIIERLNNQ